MTFYKTGINTGNIKNNNPETWKDYTVEFMDRSFVWNYYHIESIEVEPNFDESCSFLQIAHIMIKTSSILK